MTKHQPTHGCSGCLGDTSCNRWHHEIDYYWWKYYTIKEAEEYFKEYGMLPIG